MERLLRVFQKKERLVAGIMSGTSLDGADVALIRVKGSGEDVRVELLAFKTVPYTAALRRDILAVSGQDSVDVAAVCRLNFVLGEVFAAAVTEICRENSVNLADLDLIGSHGQTIRHLPADSTLQIGEPAVIAERTGIITVADFRVRDVAAGGHGAPLVPYTEYLLYRDSDRTRLLQNIGGIANVTALPAGCGPGDVLAFDTGPGNMMIDICMERLTGGRQHFDAGGRLAGTGTVHQGLLGELLGHPYLRQLPPKTTGRETFGTEYTNRIIDRYVQQGAGFEDILATFTYFTARSIAESYRRFIFPIHKADQVVVGGGGRHNATLLAMLRREMPGISVLTQEDLGFSSDAKEAVAFGLLASETVSGRANNLPAVTGARRQVIMGKILL